MKRIITAVMVVVVVMLGDAAVALGQKTTERKRVHFKLTAETCPRLPTGTTFTGSGRQKSVTNTTTNPDGTTTVVNYTRARGVAKNQRGVRYQFDYRNSFSVTNTTANPMQYSGTMFDLFDLVRNARTRLANGFIAVFTTDLGASNSFQPLYAFGDPIEFPSGAAHCDPLLSERARGDAAASARVVGACIRRWATRLEPGNASIAISPPRALRAPDRRVIRCLPLERRRRDRPETQNGPP